MSGLVEGGLLEVAFDRLLQAVTDVAKRVVFFNSVLKPLQLTLADLKPIVHDTAKLNDEFDHRNRTSESLLNLLQEGEALFGKCLKVNNKWYFPCKKYYYSRKIDDFKEKLAWFFHINVQAEISSNSKLNLVQVASIEEKLDRVLSILLEDRSGSRSIGFSGCCYVPKLPDFLVGIDGPVEEVKGMLLNGLDTVVVVSAPGGCGKTTLVSKLCDDVEIKGRFGNNIFFVTVSQTPELQVIVKEVFKIVNNHQVPNFRNEEDAINQYEHLMLRQIGHDPLLLVLDDVWSGSEGLIEKLNFEKPGYKILVTSRFIFPGYESSHKLKPLGDENAMTLFCHLAFKDGIINVRKELVDKVVRACGGFPLALTVVGRSLYKQHEATWITRVRKISGHTIFDANAKLLECLATSLDALQELEILKECYMDLGLFPDDQKIPAAVLLDMWTELYNLDEDGIYALSYLEDLSNRNLLCLTLARKEASDIVIDYCNQHFVTQHDLLRELAIYQGSRDPVEKRQRLILDIKGNVFPKWWINKEMQPNQARVLSITTDEMFSSNWQDVQLPGLEVLILNIRSTAYAFPKFMDEMSCLSVLIITNYGPFPSKLFGVEIIDRLPNLKRIRLEHVSVSLFSSSMIQLKNLQKLSLVMCKIGKALEISTVVMNNIWPNLRDINIDYCNDLLELPAWLCCLVQLRKLSISYCQELISFPPELGNLTNLEILRLHSCTQLRELPESISKLQRLRFLELSDLLIEYMPAKLGNLHALTTIRMIGCRGLYELPHSVVDLRQLEHVICDEEASYLWETCGLENVKISVIKADTNWSWHLIVPDQN